VGRCRPRQRTLGCALALIRPDGIVAWRGENATDDPAGARRPGDRTDGTEPCCSRPAPLTGSRASTRTACCLPRLSRNVEVLIRDGRLPELESSPVRKRIALAGRFRATPVRRPGKIIVIGLNYRGPRGRDRQRAARAAPLPPDPELCRHRSLRLRAPTRIAPDRVDYEGELAIVIGPRRGATSPRQQPGITSLAAPWPTTCRPRRASRRRTPLSRPPARPSRRASTGSSRLGQRC